MCLQDKSSASLITREMQVRARPCHTCPETGAPGAKRPRTRPAGQRRRVRSPVREQSPHTRGSPCASARAPARRSEDPAAAKRESQYLKKTRHRECRRARGETGTLCTAAGTQTGAAAVGRSTEVPQKHKPELPRDPATPLPGQRRSDAHKPHGDSQPRGSLAAQTPAPSSTPPGPNNDVGRRGQ